MTFDQKTSPVTGYKYTTVFGVHVFTQDGVDEAKLQHVASVLASWMDNDQDGCVDTPAIATKLVASKGAQVTENNNLMVPWGRWLL